MIHVRPFWLLFRHVFDGESALFLLHVLVFHGELLLKHALILMSEKIFSDG